MVAGNAGLLVQMSVTNIAQPVLRRNAIKTGRYVDETDITWIRYIDAEVQVESYSNNSIQYKKLVAIKSSRYV